MYVWIYFSHLVSFSQGRLAEIDLQLFFFFVSSFHGALGQVESHPSFDVDHLSISVVYIISALQYIVSTRKSGPAASFFIM